MDGGAREVEKFKLTDFWVFGLFCLFVCLFVWVELRVAGCGLRIGVGVGVFEDRWVGLE